MALPAPHRTGRHVARAGPRLAAAACCLALGITACSSDGDAEPEPPTAGTDAPGATAGTGTSAPGTTAMADEEAAVLEAVKVWPASIEFVSTPERRPTLTASPRDGLGIAPARSLVLEDSDEGLEAASRAGMTAWDVRDPVVLARIGSIPA